MIICSPQEQALSDPNSVELHLGESPDITSLVTMFETSDTLARIYIPTDNVEIVRGLILEQLHSLEVTGRDLVVQAEIEPSTSTEPTVTPAWQE